MPHLIGTKNPDTEFPMRLASAALVAGDEPRGLALLRAALRKDQSLADVMPADPDLRSVWKNPAFLNLTAAALFPGIDGLGRLLQEIAETNAAYD